MGSHRSQAISFFNEQVQTLRANTGNMDTKVSLVTFPVGATNRVGEPAIWNKPVAEVQELNEASYVPNGGTPLNDAVGLAISRLAELPEASDPNTSFLVIVISDGEENASTQWDGPRVAAKIREMTATNRWTFAYMGSGVDFERVQQMGFAANNIHTMAVMDMGQVTMRNATATRSYMAGRGQGMTAMANFYEEPSVDDPDTVTMSTTDTVTVTIKKD
jgi:uncharacterized protein YegL